MQPLTDAGQRAVQELAQRYGVSVDAALALLFAVSAGGGTMAQFYHPELGGGGQWMQGGMTMVGDMFNGRLQHTVSGLCSELSTLLRSTQVFLPPAAEPSSFGSMQSSNTWWPSELGQPSSSGGQNDTRYAYFPGPRRLAVQRGGQVTVYDTLDHAIGGVQQQQGGPYGSQSFSSQFGTFTVESLPIVSPQQQQQQQPSPVPYAPMPPPPAPPAFSGPAQQPSASGAAPDIFAAIEGLAQLHQRGILSDDEFRTKKAELLARL
ncbi:MAG: SHOCT domain-containing protein [Deltaproteobacteria bacterium]